MRYFKKRMEVMKVYFEGFPYDWIAYEKSSNTLFILHWCLQGSIFNLQPSISNLSILDISKVSQAEGNFGRRLYFFFLKFNINRFFFTTTYPI